MAKYSMQQKKIILFFFFLGLHVYGHQESKSYSLAGHLS